MLRYRIQHIASEGAPFSLTPYLVVGMNNLGHSWRQGWYETKAEAAEAVRLLKLTSC